MHCGLTVWICVSPYPQALLCKKGEQFRDVTRAVDLIQGRGGGSKAGVWFGYPISEDLISALSKPILETEVTEVLVPNIYFAVFFKTENIGTLWHRSKLNTCTVFLSIRKCSWIMVNFLVFVNWQVTTFRLNVTEMIQPFPFNSNGGRPRSRGHSLLV